MHYFITISLLMFVFAPLLKSQTFGTSLKLVEGMPETYSEDREVLRGFFVLNGEELYVVRERLALLGLGQRTSTLERYSADLSSKDVSAWNFGWDGEFGYFIGAVNLDGNSYFFTLKRYKEEKKEHLYCWNFDEEEYKLTNKRKLVAVDQSLRTGYYPLHINFATSPDSSHIAIYLEPQTPRSERRDGTYTIAMVFNEKLEEIKNFTWKFPIGNNKFEFSDLAVTNDGSVFILARETNSGLSDFLARTPRITHHLAFNSGGDNDVNFRTFDSDSEYISSMKLATDNRNYVYAIGINSTKWMSKNQKSKGITTFKMDGLSGEIILEKSVDFPTDFVVQGLGKGGERRMRKRAKKGRVNQVDEYHLDRVLMGSDENILLIGEQRKLKKVSKTSYESEIAGPSVRYLTVHGGIMTLNMTKGGDIIWGKRINRFHTEQERRNIIFGNYTSMSNTYSDYNTFYSDNNLYFLYNDNTDNLNLAENSKPRPLKIPRNTDWFLARINNNGNKAKVALNSYKDSKLLLIPDFSQQISNSELVMFAGYRKRFGLFKLYLQ